LGMVAGEFWALSYLRPSEVGNTKATSKDE
jgi:hypothetical protein